MEALITEWLVRTAEITKVPTSTARPVDTVRLGERKEFANASLPVCPRRATPKKRTRGMRTHGVRRKTAMPRKRHASSTEEIADPPSLFPIAAIAIITPARAERIPKIPPKTLGFLTAWLVLALMALIGEILSAVRAGISEASTVTAVHMSTPAINAVGEKLTMNELNIAFRMPPTAYTSPEPMTEKKTPIISDSMRSIRTSEPPRAPRVRSRASSRTRCPTSTAKVFEMTNEETNRARIAKAIRMVFSELKSVENCFFR